jgi:predicted transcriptional regulator
MNKMLKVGIVTVREQQPDSIDSLATVVGKQDPNLSRSLHTMAVPSDPRRRSSI